MVSVSGTFVNKLLISNEAIMLSTLVGVAATPTSVCTDKCFSVCNTVAAQIASENVKESLISKCESESNTGCSSYLSQAFGKFMLCQTNHGQYLSQWDIFLVALGQAIHSLPASIKKIIVEQFILLSR